MVSTRFLRRRSAAAREQACLEVEVSISRIAKLVLHASALADRMEAIPASDLDSVRRRRERVGVLRGAAEAGERAIRDIGLAASQGASAASGGRWT